MVATEAIASNVRRSSPAGQPIAVEITPARASAKQHTALLLELFGNERLPVVCSFIAPTKAASATRFCREIAFELAASQGTTETRVALLDGAVLLAGRSEEELELSSGRYGESSSAIWSWSGTAASGSASPAAAPLALHDTFQALRARFDHILIDCPPVAASSMAVPLAAMADKTVLLIEQGNVRRAEIRTAQRALVSRAAPLVGCVLFGDNKEALAERPR